MEVVKKQLPKREIPSVTVDNSVMLLHASRGVCTAF